MKPSVTAFSMTANNPLATPNRHSVPWIVRAGFARSPGILMTEDQCRLVGSAVRLFPRCRFLVFGTGRDSLLWQELNSDGTTVFLEHSEAWRQEVLARHPGLDVIPITYSTSILQWRELLANPAALHLDLPARIRDTRWDVVLVDGPPGHLHVAHDPRLGTIHGRMQSIAAARELVADGGFVIVDDTNREIENAYANAYLGRDARVFTWRSRRRSGTRVEMQCFHFPGAGHSGRRAARRLQFMAAWMKVTGLFGLRATLAACFHRLGALGHKRAEGAEPSR